MGAVEGPRIFALYLAISALGTIQASLIPSDMYLGCGETKGCYVTPSGCKGFDCDYIVTYTQTDGYTDFEMAGAIDDVLGRDQYVSFGFADEPEMPGASVMDCIYYGGNFTIWDSFNYGYTNDLLDDPTVALVAGYSAGAIVDNHISCNFRRLNSVAGNYLVANISATNEYYMLVAQGIALSPILKIYHHIRFSSASEIDFSETLISTGDTTNSFVRAHAVLMTLAWGFMAGFGVLNSRFYKEEWEGKTIMGLPVWFANHRNVLFMVAVLTVLGVIMIFKEIGSYLASAHSYTLGTLGILNAHPPIGLAVMVLVIVNPIMSLFRGKKDAKYRWLFNWAHLFVGELAMILGYMNILLGLRLPATGDVADWRDFWFMVTYGILHAVVEILLFLYERCGRKGDDGEHQKLTPEAEGAPPKPTSLLSTKQAILGIYCIIGIPLCVATCVRMGLT